MLSSLQRSRPITASALQAEEPNGGGYEKQGSLPGQKKLFKSPRLGQFIKQMHYDRNRVTIDNEKARSANEKRFTYDDNLKRQRILKRNVKPLPQSKSAIQLKKPEKPINYLH